MRYKGPFHHLTLCCAGLVLAFILLPLWELMTSSPPAALAGPEDARWSVPSA